VQRRRSRITATKETRKATTKQWRTTSKSNKKPGGEKKTKKLSLSVSPAFHQVLHQKQNCEAPHRKQNTRLGQNFQNPKKKSKHIHLILSSFSPLGRAGNIRKLTRTKHQPSRTMGGRARSEDKQGSVAKRKIEETTQGQSQKRKKKKSKRIFFKKRRILGRV
jgi:hypothetical protein